MGARYYLVNGRFGKGTPLFILNKDELQNNFDDISTLDLLTLGINNEDKKDILQEYNKDKELDGIFYDASYPHKDNKTKVYVPIFDNEKEEAKYYLENLRYFAEQRSFKKENKKTIGLDNNRQFNEYVRILLRKIFSEGRSHFVSYDSLVAAKIKEMIDERYDDYSYNSADNYINGRIYVLKNFLSNYNQLRNITIEYLRYLDGKRANLRSSFNSKAYWENNLVPEESKLYISGDPVNHSDHQFTFEDYENHPKILNIKKHH